MTGLPVVRRPEWTEIRLDENYRTTIEIVGGHILKSIPSGYATVAGVAKLTKLHREAIAAAIKPGAPHVHIADYTNFKGSTFEARRAFAADLKTRDGLAALIVHNTPPLFKLSIRLGRRILGLKIPVEITADYPAAIRRACDILRKAGVEDLPTIDETGDAPTLQKPESGTVGFDSIELQYETVDGHIVHGKLTGFIGLTEMARIIEFENLIISSVDPADGPLTFVIDLRQLEGLSPAARRLYVSTLRSRQRSRPIALYVCYGASRSLRHAINISRPFLPYRVRLSRDWSSALEMARRERHRAGFKPVDRIRGPITKNAGAFSAPQPSVDDLLRLIADIEWESEGSVVANHGIGPDDPLAPVVDALELIKAEVDDLFRVQRKAELALRESEERYRNILDSIVDGYYEINLRGQLTFFNDALLRIFGYSRTEVDSVNALELLDPEHRAEAVADFTRVYETGEPAHSIDWEIGTRDGGKILIEASISLITDAEGQPVGFRGIIRDVTERVRTAQEKADLEVQLQRSQRMEAIGTLAGGIAHNFNNLLMGIQGNVSLLLRELESESPHSKRLDTVEALVAGGSKLTAQLLGYARSGRVDVRTIDLNTLVRETAETFSLTRREYRVHTDLTDCGLPIEVDPAQIEQALLNLLINAADAMPRGGDITLHSRVADHTEVPGLEPGDREGSYAVLSVQDAGCGMDPDTLEHIFEPFFTTKGMTGGTGLGLASTYGIVRAHGGQIDVASTVGEGSTFTMVFPTSARPPDTVVAGRGQPVEGEGTIMIVEDDEAVLDACASMLTVLNYTPICVSSGQAAIDIYSRRNTEIDLVILDLILTDMGGGEVFEAIRAIAPEARILLSSGYSLDGDAAGLLERGCDDFIQKPFTMEQLSRKLERLLRSDS
jgi:PAS domain S-box-containing protein